jgi:outer membrane protein insertion porin family
LALVSVSYWKNSGFSLQQAFHQNSFLRPFLLTIASLLMMMCTSALAETLVSEVVIKGNKKIEREAILSKILLNSGEEYSTEKVRKDVKTLFETGYFFDIKVYKTGASNVSVTFEFQEKPSIEEIEFVGNDEVPDDEIREIAALKPYEILDYGKIKEAQDKILKMYEDKGFFLARVTYGLEPIEKTGNVKLKIIVTEKQKVEVKKITFLGNKDIPTSELKKVMITKEGGAFSFISGSGSYKQEAFDRDVQVLNFLYFNKGYVQVKIDRPQVYVTPDKKSIFVTIRIDEGKQFDVGNVDFTGTLLFDKDELYETVEIDESKLFVFETIQRDVQELQKKYGDLGYAFANIIRRTKIREKEQLVDITFEIDKGNKVYIGQINVVGNSKTRDKVLRREMRLREGELYNETKKRESLANIQRLGFFEEVNFNTKSPRGRNDLMDIDIVVKERNTGTIQVGAGFSSFAGFVFNGQVNQINFLGRGQSLGASVDISDLQSLFRLNFTEPYFMNTRWVLGFDAYQSRRFLTQFSEVKRGGAVRVGHPLAPYLNGFIRYKYDSTDLELDSRGDPDLFPVETAEGVTSSVTLTIEYDKRNDRFAPSKGIYSSMSLEYAGLGGDLSYTKGLTTFRYYKKLFWEVVWRNNLNYGFVTANNPSQEPPFNELFLLGGANSLRGYEWFTIGKRKKSNKALAEAIANGDPDAERTALKPFGGEQQFYYNLEFQFPLIGEAGINGVVFYDVGNADDTILVDELVQAVGAGFRWFSPIGPLRFEWGFPVGPQEFEIDPVNFQFAIGAPF